MIFREEWKNSAFLWWACFNFFFKYLCLSTVVYIEKNGKNFILYKMSFASLCEDKSESEYETENFYVQFISSVVYGLFAILPSLNVSFEAWKKLKY